jgi:hypothetical protein
MKTHGTLLPIVTFALVLSGCTTRHALPDWVLKPDAAYSSSRYITAVGVGDTLRAAEGQAFSRLAGRFKTRIQSNEQLSDRVAESFGKTESFEKNSVYLSDIQLETNETLLNVETLEQFRDATGRIYVLAALNRLETARLYDEKIHENAQRIQSLNPYDPYPLKEYAQARQALALGLENQLLINQLAVIHRDAADMLMLPYQLDALRQRTAQAGHAVQFNVAMKDASAEPFARQIAAVMTQRGFTEKDRGDLRITGSVQIREVAFLRNDLHTVRYQLQLNLTDASGKTWIALQNEGRESRLTLHEAQRHAELIVNALIEQELNERLNTMLAQLVGGADE